MPKPADLNRCLAPLDQDHTIIAVIEMSQSSWLVAGVVPGIARHPLKKLAPDQDALLTLLPRWREEAGQAGRAITRIAVAFEAGRDGFWLARWLRAHEPEGTVNLIGSGRDTAHEGLCPSGHAGDRGPGLEGLGSGGSILDGGAVIAAEVEEVGNLIVSGEEALGLTG